MEINLPSDLNQFVVDQAARKGYSAEAYVAELIAAQQQRIADNEAIRQGIQDAESGRHAPAEEVFHELREELHSQYPELRK